METGRWDAVCTVQEWPTHSMLREEAPGAGREDWKTFGVVSTATLGQRERVREDESLITVLYDPALADGLCASDVL